MDSKENGPEKNRKKEEEKNTEEEIIKQQEITEGKKKRGRKKNHVNSQFFAKNLKALRENQSWTQTGIAKALGMSRLQYSRYEIGDQEPSIQTLAKILKIYNISVSDILGSDLSISGLPNPDNASPPSGLQMTRKQRKRKPQRRVRKLTVTEENQIGLIRLASYSKIRLLGHIVAGIPIETQEDFEGYVLTTYGPEEEYFALRVNGNSMINAGIPDKSIVIVHRQDVVDNGDIAVCLINDEATVKRVMFDRKKNIVILQPENTAYTPIVVFETDKFLILGKVVQVQIDL